MENPDYGNNKNVSLSLIAEYGSSDSDSDDTETRSNNCNDDSDAVELSEMVLKNNIINACAHGPLSRGSGLQDLEVSRHMIIDSAESGVVEYEVTEYRDVDVDSESSSSSDSSDSDIESVKDIEEISSGDENEGGTRSTKLEAPKVRGELALEDLPPIEDLAISLPAQQTVKIGTIASIVGRLAVVRALPDTPAVDLDSVLFLEKGAKALGTVFDVFGPVTEPCYCVRFNSEEHARTRGAQPGMDVYIAPHTPHTKYVFLAELMKLKGSDSSWLHDVETPPSQADYSDDEQERRAKKEHKQNRQDNEDNGETSLNQAARKMPDKRNQRPFESSSRFGSGPSRGRNQFPANSRRNPNSFPRFTRPWSGNMELRTPPHNGDPGGPFSAPPIIHNGPPIFPPFSQNLFQFPRMRGPPPLFEDPPMFSRRQNQFGPNYCNISGPQWVNNAQPPPPGT